MTINIQLKFDNTITRLAGNPYGKKVYNEQVKGKFNYDKINIIVFPKTIEDIAISFVQGFISELLENLTIDTLLEHIEISASDKVKNKFYQAVYY